MAAKAKTNYALITCLTQMAGEREWFQKQVTKLEDQLKVMTVATVALNNGVLPGPAQLATLMHALWKDNLYTRRMILLKHAEAADRTLAYLQDTVSDPGQMAKYVKHMLDPDPSLRVGGPNLVAAMEAEARVARSKMADAIRAWKPRALGTKVEQADVDAVMANLGWGAPLRSDLAGIAKGVREGFDYLLDELGRFGVPRHRMENWVPVMYDRMRVSGAGEAEWLADAHHFFDFNKMFDMNTGLPLAALDSDTVNGILRYTRQSIIYMGMNKLPAGAHQMYGGANSFVGRMIQDRFIMFRDFDSYKAFHEKYGRGTTVNAIFDHVDRASRIVGIMRVLGPDPAAMLGLMSKWAKEGAAEAGKPITDISDDLKNLFSIAIGTSDAVGESRIGQAGGTLRVAGVAAQLGTAIFSALGGDLTQTIASASVTGLKTSSIVSTYFKLFAPGSDDLREHLLRVGVNVRSWNPNLYGGSRYWFESGGKEWAEKLSNVVMRASLMERHTESIRSAVEMEMISELSRLRGHAWGSLDDDFRKMLVRNGFTEDLWSKLASAPTVEREGLQWLTLDSLNEHNWQLATQVASMLTSEANYFVVMSTPRSKQLLGHQVPADTLAGQALRTLGFIKGFPVATMLLNYGRMMHLEDTNRWKYAAGIVLLGIQLGTLTYAARLLIQGKQLPEPQDANEWAKLAKTGLYNSGVLGFIGDVLLADYSTMSGGVQSMLLGPIFGHDLPQAIMTGQSAVSAITGDEKANPGRNFVNLLRLVTPGSTLWYTRLAMDRLVFDELQKMLDNDPYASFARKEQYVKQIQGTQYFDFARPGYDLGLR